MSDAAETAKPLAQALLQSGKVTGEQLDQALKTQQETGAFLGEILVEQEVLDEESVITFLAKHCRIPHLSLLDYLIDPEIVGLVPSDTCLEYRLIPIDRLGRNLTVAMVNPLNTGALEHVQQLHPDLRIKPILCSHQHFTEVAQKHLSSAAVDTRQPGAVDLTASSLGFRLPPKSAAAEAPVSPTPAPESEAAPVSAEVNEAVDLDQPVIMEAPTSAPKADDPFCQIPKMVLHEPDPVAVKQGDALVDTVFGLKVDDMVPEPAADPEGLDMESSALIQNMATAMIDSMRDTYALLARRMKLFQGLDPESIAKLFVHGVTQEAAPGTLIFEKGEDSHQIFSILEGEVEVFDGEQTLAVLKQSDSFGEMAFVSKAPRSASVRALTECSLLILDQDVLDQQMPREVSNQLLINIILTLSERLRQANAS